jgi:hypothetical protein
VCARLDIAAFVSGGFVVVVELGALLYNGADQGAILPIFNCCESIVQVHLVQWVACEVFHVLPALGMLGVLQPPDPSVLLVLALRDTRCMFISRYVPRVVRHRTRDPACHHPHCEGKPCRLDNPASSQPCGCT